MINCFCNSFVRMIELVRVTREIPELSEFWFGQRGKLLPRQELQCPGISKLQIITIYAYKLISLFVIYIKTKSQPIEPKK